VFQKPDRRGFAPAGVALLLSLLGYSVHNAVELPSLTPLSPENSIPLVIAVVLGVLCWRSPSSRLLDGILLAWGLLFLVGGAIISVLPLGILPFQPDQSLSHYILHAQWGLLQLPLIWMSARRLRSPRR
jgi:hypothetical protein